jgi:hypothetical protein
MITNSNESFLDYFRVAASFFQGGGENITKNIFGKYISIFNRCNEAITHQVV